MAAKKAEKHAAPTQSKLRAGTGSRRVLTRLIVIYGPAAVRKTGSLRNLVKKRTKWLISDSNALPTLRALDSVPAPEDIYEVSDLSQARGFIAEMLDLIDKEGVDALGIDTLALDSITQFSDWHQQDTAKGTNQRFMGDNSKNNGWQQFNAEFGAFLDDLARLAQYINVVAIAHAVAKPDFAKSEWSGIALTPQMSLKLSRLANWILYATLRRWEPGEDSDIKADEYIELEKVRGKVTATESILHTKPYGLWMTRCSSSKLLGEEPSDIVHLMEKDGLL